MLQEVDLYVIMTSVIMRWFPLSAHFTARLELLKVKEQIITSETSFFLNTIIYNEVYTQQYE